MWSLIIAALISIISVSAHATDYSLAAIAPTHVEHNGAEITTYGSFTGHDLTSFSIGYNDGQKVGGVKTKQSYSINATTEFQLTDTSVYTRKQGTGWSLSLSAGYQTGGDVVVDVTRYRYDKDDVDTTATIKAIAGLYGQSEDRVVADYNAGEALLDGVAGFEPDYISKRHEADRYDRKSNLTAGITLKFSF